MAHVFGPVASRRLGYSLGVELINAKTCSFACIYCQAGQTTVHTATRKEYVPAKEVLSELKAVLPQKGLHYVTFSGSGEPTLHSGIGQIIDEIKKITHTPVCVITNSSLIDRADVQQDLAKADVVIPSLDSAIQKTFEKLNRPVKGITVEKIIQGLAKFKKSYTGQMWLEIMLVKGFNESLEEAMKLKEAIDLIRPDRVDINTVVRPPWSDKAIAVDDQDIQRFSSLFGDVAQRISGFDKTNHASPSGGLDEEVYELVRRRGITLTDLVTGMGLHKDVATDILGRLIVQGKIKKVSFGGKTYYRENY